MAIVPPARNATSMYLPNQRQRKTWQPGSSAPKNARAPSLPKQYRLQRTHRSQVRNVSALTHKRRPEPRRPEKPQTRNIRAMARSLRIGSCQGSRRGFRIRNSFDFAEQERISRNPNQNGHRRRNERARIVVARTNQVARRNRRSYGRNLVGEI